MKNAGTACALCCDPEGVPLKTEMRAVFLIFIISRSYHLSNQGSNKYKTMKSHLFCCDAYAIYTYALNKLSSSNRQFRVLSSLRRIICCHLYGVIGWFGKYIVRKAARECHS